MNRSTIDTAFADLRRQWSGNPRLRAGVIVIGAILALYTVLLLRDWQVDLRAQYAARTEYLNKMKALAGQDAWVARAAAVARTRAALEAEIPAVATTGLAQADVQGWLRDAATAFGKDIQVRADAPALVPGSTDVWRVPVTVSGSLDPARYIQFLAQIERRPTLSVIEQATLLNRNNRTFSVTVVSYYRIEGEGGNARD